MKEKVQEELKKLEELNIIRPTETPTDWCAPTLAVPKPNGKVRLCIDFTKLNDSVHQENSPGEYCCGAVSWSAMAGEIGKERGGRRKGCVLWVPSCSRAHQGLVSY